MSNKYFTIIVIIIGVILLGIFATWLLINRGYITSSLINSNSDTSNPSSVFPSDTGPDSNTTENSSNFDQNPSASTTVSETLLSADQGSSVLTKLDTAPIGQLLALGQGTSTILFFERATGHLFQILPTGPAFRLSNTTLPKVIRAWGGLQSSSTNFIISTNNNRLDTKLASLSNPNSASSSTSVFLGTEEEVGSNLQTLNNTAAPTGAFDFAVSPLQNQMAYLTLGNQGSNLTVAGWNNTKPEKVASLPLTQISLTWPASTTIALQTKAASSDNGLLYFYNVKTKKLEQIMDGVKGLETRVSPDARYVLYSSGGNQSIATAIYDRRTGKIEPLPFKTLASKCVWGSQSDKIYCGAPASVTSGNYPDTWYQGLISFADNLWELELSTKKATLLFNPQLNNLDETIDVTQPTLDEIGNRLYFVNKNDFSLWYLTLESSF